MAKGKDKDYVSFWFWMFALFVTALPCIGFVMIIVWAFVGTNESRKNYFRAIIAWAVIVTAIWIVLMATGLTVGFWPEIQREFQHWTQRK